MFKTAIGAYGDILISVVISVVFARRLLLLDITTQTKNGIEINIHKSKISDPSLPQLRMDGNDTSNTKSVLEECSPTDAVPNPSSPIGTNLAYVSPTTTPVWMPPSPTMPSFVPSFSRKKSNPLDGLQLNHNNLTWKILGKSTLLTFIALASSEICLVLAGVLELEALWTSIDSVVNCWCVMLIFAIHKKIYAFGCEKLQNGYNNTMHGVVHVIVAVQLYQMQWKIDLVKTARMINRIRRMCRKIPIRMYLLLRQRCNNVM